MWYWPLEIVQAHGSLGVWHQIAHHADDFKPRSRLLDGLRILHSVTDAASDRIPAGQDFVHEQVVDDDRVGTDSVSCGAKLDQRGRASGTRRRSPDPQRPWRRRALYRSPTRSVPRRRVRSRLRRRHQREPLGQGHACDSGFRGNSLLQLSSGRFVAPQKGLVDCSPSPPSGRHGPSRVAPQGALRPGRPLADAMPAA